MEGRSNKSKASTQTKRASSTSSRGSRTSQSATRIPVATGFRPESATIAVMMQDAAVQTSDNDRHSDILTPEEHPASDSDIGLDADKIHPEGDDYKIVFISSDSSKSSLEGSFDTADAMNSTIHDSTDIGNIPNSIKLKQFNIMRSIRRLKIKSLNYHYYIKFLLLN